MSVTHVRWPILLLVALAVSFLAACGTDDDLTPTPSPSGTTDDTPTSSAGTVTDFEAACSLVTLDLVVAVLRVEDPIRVENEDERCAFQGPDSTLTIVLNERESTDAARAAAKDAGGAADPVQLGDDVGYVVGTLLVTSHDVYFVAFTLEPRDDEALIDLATRALVRIPTPVAPE